MTYAEGGVIGDYLDVESSVLEQPTYDLATDGAPLAAVPQYDLAAPQLHTPSPTRHGTLEADGSFMDGSCTATKGDLLFAETTM